MVRNKWKTEGEFCGVNHVLPFLSFMPFLKLLEGTICLETCSKCLEDGQSGTVSSFPPKTEYIIGLEVMRSRCPVRVSCLETLKFLALTKLAVRREA